MNAKKLILSSGAAHPSSLYAASQDGALFEFYDLMSGYQESTGLTAAASEQPLGWVGDKRLGMARGAELTSTGQIFTASGAGATGGDRIGTFTAAAGGANVSFNYGLIAGAMYEVTYTVSGFSSGNVRVDLGGGSTLVLRTANGTYTEKKVSTPGSILYMSCGASTTAVVTLDSLKLISGNHVTQAIAASRPTAKSGGSALWDGADDSLIATAGGAGTAGFLLLATVTPTGGAGSTRTIWSDAGANTGYRVSINASNALELAIGTGAGYTTLAGEPMPINSTHVILCRHDGVTMQAQVNDGQIATAPCSAASAGTAAFTIGKDNGSDASFYAGNIRDLVYRRNTPPSLAQTQRVKRWMMRRAGQ